MSFETINISDGRFSVLNVQEFAFELSKHKKVKLRFILN